MYIRFVLDMIINVQKWVGKGVKALSLLEYAAAGEFHGQAATSLVRVKTMSVPNR